MMDSYFCATCRTALDVRTDSDHPDRVSYLHTAANTRLGRLGAAHEPVPVSLGDLDGPPSMCCDICTTGDAAWVYLAGDISVVMGDNAGTYVHTEHYDPRWTVCTACADLIDARKLGGLVRAGMAGQPPMAAVMRDGMREMLADLYRPLLATIVGDRMPLAHLRRD